MLIQLKRALLSTAVFCIIMHFVQGQLTGVCRDTGAVRLVGGNTDREGRVEVCLDGRWGTICDDLWNGDDAKVICRQLRFTTNGALAAANSFFGPGSGPIHLDNVECSGDEMEISRCIHAGTGIHNCQHTEDASVICQPENFTCEDGTVRLVDGTVESEGRVEICFNNQFGTVCDDNWDGNDAAVVCFQLGFGREDAIGVTRTQTFGVGVGNIYLDDVGCEGTETNLTQCSHRGVGISNCRHTEDAGVICRTPPGIAVCTNGDVRLNGGRIESEGRVEICFNNHWGTVCDDNWGEEDAQVVCRQLDFPTENVIHLTSGAFGPGDGAVFLDNVDCIGNETRLEQCSHFGLGIHNCIHTEDAGVVCDDPKRPQCINGTVRLADGLTTNEGRVELCVNNHWGTVCDDLWDAAEATVVCSQLGYTHGQSVALPRSFFGNGIGIIWFDDMRCIGNETSLLECKHRGFGISNCAHGEDANIICPPAPGSPKECENGEVRLVNGTVSNEGRVEVCFHNRWGTVCDDNWNSDNARVICKQLGFPENGSLAAIGAFFGQGTGPILLDNVDCVGNESQLLQCRSEEVGQQNCAHSEDAGVVCPALNPSCKNGDVRLAGGGIENQGRVEVCINNRWGTICSGTSIGTTWDNRDAAVVCRTLGYDLKTTNAIAVSGGAFGPGEGPIFLSNVRCMGEEENLLNCANSGIAFQTLCGHAQDAGVICTVPACTKNSFQLVGGRDQSSGRIEVCVRGVWGSVSANSFDVSTAAKVCTQLGFQASGFKMVGGGLFGPGSGKVYSVSVNGSGTVVTNFEGKNHNNDAGLFCLANNISEVICNTGDVRLANGNDMKGRVEVCLNNKWGTVCDDSWDNNGAAVICRQLGMNPTGATTEFFGEADTSVEILLDDIKCLGNELNLLDCRRTISSSTQSHNCRHSEDAGAICQGNTRLTTDQAVAIIVPTLVVAVVLVTAIVVVLVLIVYMKKRTKQADLDPIMEADGGPAVSAGQLDFKSDLNGNDKPVFEEQL